jgi:hypothetical protein
MTNREGSLPGVDLIRACSPIFLLNRDSSSRRFAELTDLDMALNSSRAAGGNIMIGCLKTSFKSWRVSNPRKRNWLSFLSKRASENVCRRRESPHAA